MRRGAEKILIWMLSEAGEGADAFLKGDVDVLLGEKYLALRIIC